ncbi:MAG: radical SAM family heme chaperone HemW [Actinomycetota bacterium]
MTNPTLTRLPRPRDVLREFGLYVHVPFCSHRCGYCDFNAYAGIDHAIEEYMTALVTDARYARSAPVDADVTDRPEVTSIFVGGGTPSLVPAASIGAVLDAIRGSWPVSRDAEITIECNPESTEDDKLAAYLEAGVTRISFGVQSLDNELLLSLGRTHDAETALDALDRAGRAGFENVSADLIFGIPGEDDERWLESLEGVLERGTSHVSAYALIYEEGTPLESWRKLGKVVPVDDDTVARRWELGNAVFAEAGFERYEFSNWCRPGRNSVHNSLYWKCGEYLGIGAGAHSHLATEGGARRSWAQRGPERYARTVLDGSSAMAGSEEIQRRMRASEVMLLGLRRTEGIKADTFEGLVGVSLQDTYPAELARGVDRGLLTWDGECVRLARPLLGNEAALLFVD